MRYSAALSLLILVACAKSAPLAEQWLGKWIGPEGTSLTISETGGEYHVAIQDLDNSITYPATIDANNLTFTRNGQKETVSAGNGQDTGMKWLVDKQNCLVIKAGEGFCRD